MATNRGNKLSTNKNGRDGTPRVRGDHEKNSAEKPRARGARAGERDRATDANARQTRRRNVHAKPLRETDEARETGSAVPDSLALFFRRGRVYPLLSGAGGGQVASGRERGEREGSSRSIRHTTHVVA